MFNGYGYIMDMGGGGGSINIVTDSTDDVMHIVTGRCPTVYIESETAEEDLTKTAVDATLEYVDNATKFKLPIVLKLQGSGSASASYRTRNFNVKLLKDDDSGDSQKVMFDDWYATAKYHLKVNPQDTSVGNNSVCAKIAHEFACRKFPQGARTVIDSFPIVVYYNGVYRGCYAWSLPQDGKLFNFKKAKEKAYTNLAYRNDMPIGNDLSGFVASSFEYKGDEDIQDTTAFNALLSVIRSCETASKSDLEAVLDKKNMLEYLLFTDLLGVLDNYANNLTFATWDGIKWYLTFYDLDQAFLGGGNGTNMLIPSYVSQNTFFGRILELYEDDLPDAYANLREGGMNANSLYEIVESFYMRWGWENWEATKAYWERENVPTLSDFLALRRQYFVNKIATMDTYFNYSES